MASKAAPKTPPAGAYIPGEQSPAKLRRVDVPSLHCFRGARRHAARLMQEAKIKDLQAEVQRLEKNVRVETKCEVIEVPVKRIVEKVVEVPKEKIVEVLVEVERIVEVAVGKTVEGPEDVDRMVYCETDVRKAFDKGTQFAMEAKREMEETLLAKIEELAQEHRGLVTKYERLIEDGGCGKELLRLQHQLKESETTEFKLKDLAKSSMEAKIELKKTLAAAKLSAKELKDQQGHIAVLTKELKEHERLRELDVGNARLQRQVSDPAGLR